ncbi:hypothetical protein GCM10009760_29940 [Kitasatospora kazusensis]|uniref:UspA domain-containing protein n=1 Tax=Kitasatospora kazusensis TaxID=407974 RepID=A0ABN2ZKB7_9ACTN
MAVTTRVVVGVSGSEHGPAVLRQAWAEAVRRDAVLVPVLAWTPVGGETAYRTHPCPPLAELWEKAARERLEAALTEAFGENPVGVWIEPLVVRGETGPVLVQTAGRDGDLLVVGTGRRGRLARLLRGSVSRYCLARAACTVLAVPPTAAPAATAAPSGRERRRTLTAA